MAVHTLGILACKSFLGNGLERERERERDTDDRTPIRRDMKPCNSSCSVDPCVIHDGTGATSPAGNTQTETVPPDPCSMNQEKQLKWIRRDLLCDSARSPFSCTVCSLPRFNYIHTSKLVCEVFRNTSGSWACHAFLPGAAGHAGSQPRALG